MTNNITKEEFENLASRLESNIIHSFRLAKKDVMDLQNNFFHLSQNQKFIIAMIKELRSHEIEIYSAIQKLYQKQEIKHLEKYNSTDITRMVAELKESERRISKLINQLDNKKSEVVIKQIETKPKIHIVASKTSTKYHKSNCPYAHNIKPKNLIRFATKDSAKNKGFKPCSCLND